MYSKWSNSIQLKINQPTRGQSILLVYTLLKSKYPSWFGQIRARHIMQLMKLRDWLRSRVRVHDSHWAANDDALFWLFWFEQSWIWKAITLNTRNKINWYDKIRSTPAKIMWWSETRSLLWSVAVEKHKHAFIFISGVNMYTSNSSSELLSDKYSVRGRTAHTMQ